MKRPRIHIPPRSAPLTSLRLTTIERHLSEAKDAPSARPSRRRRRRR
jgi:hypothetical protein